MIILVTGQPGLGKTSHALDMLVHDEQFSNRPKYVMGVPDLSIDHVPCPPIDEWVEFRQDEHDEKLKLPYFTFPPGSIVFLDEAQRIYRPRSVGSAVPPIVAAFETHRHCGIDFILVTQHPNLIDMNIRRLIGRHIHLRSTALGSYIYEWPELGEIDSHSSRETASKSRFRLPRRVWSLYKSSAQHTKIKGRVPFYMWLALGAGLAFLALMYYVFQKVAPKIPGATPAATETKPAPDENHPPFPMAPAPVGAPGQPRTNFHESIDAYIETQRPRMIGLPHTAALYDGLTQPKQAPEPVGCYATASKCACVTQQGTKYDTTDDICRQLLKNPMFIPWRDNKQTGPVQLASASNLPTPATSSPQ